MRSDKNTRREFIFKAGDTHSREALFCVLPFLPSECYETIIGPVESDITFIEDVSVIVDAKAYIFKAPLLKAKPKPKKLRRKND